MRAICSKYKLLHLQIVTPQPPKYDLLINLLKTRKPCTTVPKSGKVREDRSKTQNIALWLHCPTFGLGKIQLLPPQDPAISAAGALTLTLTRISGICFGVLLSEISSVLIFPKSATQEAVLLLRKSLENLTELNAIAWQHGPLFRPEWRSALPGQGQTPLVPSAFRSQYLNIWILQLFPNCELAAISWDGFSRPLQNHRGLRKIRANFNICDLSLWCWD